jgi:peptidoglycan/LPS O-acetylase OafA/YrhL
MGVSYSSWIRVAYIPTQEEAQRVTPIDSTPAQPGSVPNAGRSAESEPKVSRITFLDGLRCLAILAVLLYHYFFSWTPPNYKENLYPYGPLLSTFFSLGSYGVELFFIISGFVIALTLYKCKSMGEFFSRRFARLFPAMALCSIITFVITSVIPDGEVFRVHIVSFLPSWTFSEPVIYNKLFSTTLFKNVDGVYWSLAIEVHFYLLISTIYFLSRKNFLRNIVAYSIATFLLELTSGAYFQQTGARWAHLLHTAAHLLQVSDFLPWFLLGIGFFLYSQRTPPAQWLTPAAVGSIQLLIGTDGEMIPLLMVILIPGIFFAAMTIPMAGRILSYRPFAQMGLASYSLYLLHQHAGLTLIRFFSRAYGLGVDASAAVALAVASAMVGLSWLIFHAYERRANKFLLRMLLNMSSVSVAGSAHVSYSAPSTDSYGAVRD